MPKVGLHQIVGVFEPYKFVLARYCTTDIAPDSPVTIARITASIGGPVKNYPAMLSVLPI